MAGAACWRCLAARSVAVAARRVGSPAMGAVLCHAGDPHGDPGAGAVGLNLALGLGGLVSFGHAAFFGIGGYAAGILATARDERRALAAGHSRSPGSIRCCGHLAAGDRSLPALVALVTGAISLRTSGVYFIMITLAFAQMIYYFAISWPAYGGEDGLSMASATAFPG
jgi:branched-chain amino acid transport system permease protein